MLVCNVSLRPPRRTIAAGIAETAAALDAVGSGNIVFATLVDDPAAVGDFVDAYLGEIMVEAASAADAVDGGMAYSADIAETATGADTQDGSVTAAPAGTTWNPSDKLATNLSNGNLTATSTGTAGVRAVSGKSSGKYYFEVTISTWSSGPQGPGMATASASLTGAAISAGKVAVASSNGTIWNNNSSSPYTLGVRASGDVIGIAVDLTADLMWMRVAPSGSWNATSGSANDPATGTGGINISATRGGGNFYPGYWTTSSGDVATLNSGGSAFVGAVPSGFTGGFS